MEARTAEQFWRTAGSQVLALETIIYAVGTAFIVLVMVKDQQVIFHRTAASPIR